MHSAMHIELCLGFSRNSYEVRYLRSGPLLCTTCKTFSGHAPKHKPEWRRAACGPNAGIRTHASHRARWVTELAAVICLRCGARDAATANRCTGQAETDPLQELWDARKAGGGEHVLELVLDADQSTTEVAPGPPVQRCNVAHALQGEPRGQSGGGEVEARRGTGFDDSEADPFGRVPRRGTRVKGWRGFAGLGGWW